MLSVALPLSNRPDHQPQPRQMSIIYVHRTTTQAVTSICGNIAAPRTASQSTIPRQTIESIRLSTVAEQYYLQHVLDHRDRTVNHPPARPATRKPHIFVDKTHDFGQRLGVERAECSHLVQG